MMDRYELDEKATTLSDSVSGYQLAKRLIRYEEFMKENNIEIPFDEDSDDEKNI